MHIKRKILEFLQRQARRRLWLATSTPDEYSRRTLIFITRPSKDPFGGFKILSWRFGEREKLERFLTETLYVVPEW